MYLPAANTLGWAVNIANTANLLATGYVVGTTALIDPTTGATDGASMATNGQIKCSVNGGAGLSVRRRSSDGSIQSFYRDTTAVGSISVTTTATAYNTSSDKRLKTNVTDYTDSGLTIDRLHVVRHGWRYGDGEAIGVLAQDAAKVFPQAVKAAMTTTKTCPTATHLTAGRWTTPGSCRCCWPKSKPCEPA